jgi:hypothetical protein
MTPERAAQSSAVARQHALNLSGSVVARAGNSAVVLGEFFAARESEVDDGLLAAPYERLETVEAKGLSELNLATLGASGGSRMASACYARSQRWRAARAKSNASFGTGGRSDEGRSSTRRQQDHACV